VTGIPGSSYRLLIDNAWIMDDVQGGKGVLPTVMDYIIEGYISVGPFPYD